MRHSFKLSKGNLVKKILSVGSVVALALLTSSLLVYQNCAPAKFSSVNNDALNGATSTPLDPGSACQSVTQVSVPLRVLIAVDNTGSNGSNKFSVQPPPGGYSFGLGSDNDQYFRQKSVGDLVSSLSQLSNITYNLMVFQDLATVNWRPTDQRQGPNVRSLINIAGNDQLPAFGDAAAMTNAMQDLHKLQPDGPTEYFTVLALLRNAILSDHAFASGSENYAIVFLSDGQPTERITADSSGVKSTRAWNGAQDEADLLAAISDLTALSAGHITFNTVFYNDITPAQRNALLTSSYDPIDPDAPGLLQKMASAGHGQFANANIVGADHVHLSNVISVPSAVCN